MKLSLRLFLALSVAPFLGAQPQFQRDLTAMHPLGYWPLGANFNDLSGSGHGLAGSVPFFNDGFQLGTPGSACCAAAYFDNGAFASTPGAPFNLSTSHPFTALAWIRTVNLQHFAAIVTKYDTSANVGWAIGLDNGDLGGPQAGGRFTLVIAAGNNQAIIVEGTVQENDGLAHLVAATYDGSGLAKGVQLYVDGVPVATTTLSDTIGGGSILNTVPVTIGAAGDGSSSFEGSIGQAAIFGSVLTPAQILQLGGDSELAQAVLAQFAFGGGWYSALYFKNAANAEGSVSFSVSFTGDNGNPLPVPSIGSTSTTLTIPPGGTAVIEAPNVGSLTQGYVSIDLPVGVAGYGVFRQSVPGIADQEAVVPLAYAYGGNNSLIYDDRNGLVTAVAIVNPTSVATTVSITAFDVLGNVIGTSSVTLQPFNKTEVALRSLPGLSGVVDHRGNVVFSVSTGSVVVLGLRFNGAAFSSIPATIGYQLRRFQGDN